MLNVIKKKMKKIYPNKSLVHDVLIYLENKG